MRKASIGSISHGTIRLEDLIPTFAWELKYMADPTDAHAAALVAEADKLEDYESADASDLLGELFDALNEYAPPYCEFCANEGDGSDYGFWPVWEALEELPRVEDSDGAKEIGEDCRAINDHGNVTLYAGDGSVIWDCV